MLIGSSFQPKGPQNRVLWERATQLLKTTECPKFSTACYQAYDELQHMADSETHGAALETTAAAHVALSTQPVVVQLMPSRDLVEHQPPPLRTITDVLAADRLNYHALAAFLSHTADLAYGTPQEIDDRIDNAKHFEKGTTAAFGYTLDGYTFLSFRGSRVSPKMEVIWSEWVRTNFNLIPWRWPLRHLGFARAWERIRESVIEWLNVLPKDSRGLVLTGHSLGGALALIAAFDLAERFPIRAIITFGAPRVGLFWFRHRYHTRSCNAKGLEEVTLHGVTRRYTHKTDRVSRVPPAPLYWHVGDEYVLDDCGGIEKGCPIDVISRFEESLDYWKLKLLLWQQKFLPEKDRTVFVRALQPTNTPPGEASVPYERSLDKRTRGAWAAFSGRFPTMIGMLAGVPVFVIWLIGVGVGVALCLTVTRDFVGAHPCAKYVEAFRRAYPNLSIESTHKNSTHAVISTP